MALSQRRRRLAAATAAVSVLALVAGSTSSARSGASPTPLDEINLLGAGNDYGWPAAEGTEGDLGDTTAPLPTFATTDASPSGLAGADGRLRTVVPAPDGALWVMTSDRDGRGDPADGDDRILRVPVA